MTKIYLNQNRTNQELDWNDKEFYKKLKAAGLNCKFDLAVKEPSKTISFNIKHQNKKCYIDIRIPNILAKIIGEHNLFTEYGECEVKNEG